jgi:C-terminal processing protease CtpA/Prc
MVGMVEADSPAAAAGLHVGDIIIAFAGEEAESSWQLGLAIRRHEEGDQAELELYRDGAPLTLTATLAERQRRMVELPRSVHGRLGHELPPHTLGPIIKRLERLRVDPGDVTLLRPHTLREEELEKRLEELEEKLEELAKRLDSVGRR